MLVSICRFNTVRSKLPWDSDLPVTIACQRLEILFRVYWTGYSVTTLVDVPAAVLEVHYSLWYL